MRHIIFAFLVSACSACFAAEEFTLWASETFAAPYTNDTIAVSGVITNQSGTYDSIKIEIVYEDFQPSPATPGITAVLEEEIAPGTWSTLGYQFERFAISGNAPKRIIIVHPGFQPDPGVDLFVDVGQGERISTNEGVIPANDMRLRLIANNSPVTSVTISAYGRKYSYSR